MTVNKVLKRQIVMEIIALLFLIAAIGYAFIAINRSKGNKVNEYQGFVSVLDDSKLEPLKKLSDGEGLEQNGITYTVTNNNKGPANYRVIIIPSLKDDSILSKVRIGVDDLYVYDLEKLEKYEDGYVLITNDLDAGYTKIHNIKIWYKEEVNDELNFEFRLVR